ncbi:MAG: hypothetical protein HY320_04190 [Armatimonadetes bacterium]|nr:hypothetical protein [Armatimonadota bacterium]
MKSLIIAGLLSLCAGVAASSPLPRTVSLTLRAATPTEAKAALEEALGAPIFLHVNPSGRVTLRLKDAAPAALLDAVAASLGAVWQRRLHVRAGPFGPQPSASSGYLVTASLHDLPARRVFALLARIANATLHLDGDLDTPVSLSSTALPVEDALDLVCQQANTTWSFSYLIVDRELVGAPVDLPAVVPMPSGLDLPAAPAPTGPPAAVSPPASGEDPRIVVRPVPEPAPSPAPPSAAPPATPTPPPASAPNYQDVRTQARTTIYRILKVEPAARQQAVQEAVRLLEQLRAYVARLSQDERAPRLQLCRPLWRNFHALFRGLPPDTRREIEPAYQALRRLIFGPE